MRLSLSFGMHAPELVYGYVTGQTKVLETQFVDSARISRLIDCTDLSEMRLVMSETTYSHFLASTDAIDQIEQALDARTADAYALAVGPDIPTELSWYFKCRHDFDNLRALLKSGFGRELDVTLSDLGQVRADEAATYVKARSFAGFPTTLKSAAYAAVDAYEETGELGAIDNELDRRYFQNLLQLASGLHSQWIIGYTQLIIELANGRVTTRARVRDMPAIRSERHLLPGADTKPTGAFDWGARVRDMVAKNPALDEYDRLAGELAAAYLKTAHLVSAGPEAVFAYIANVEREVELLRTVMMGRLSGFDPSKLKKRARESN